MASGTHTTVLTEHVLDTLSWRSVGPHRGGRVVAVAGDPNEYGTFYFGACAGGVWKTTDAGITWRCISDGFFSTAAIGALAVSRSHPNVVYAGTGETSIRGNVSHGDGIYRSLDGGKTWKNMGLRETRHIGKIQIHPQNPDLVYVAALGHAWGPSAERGIYRSVDGGENWERILHKSATAGSHDVSMDPNNPRLLYAAIWQAQRYPHKLVSGGDECGLWRSADGGDTWEEISRKPGLPTGLLGKIGVAASPVRRDRVWALIEADDGALFRSDDAGETWIRLSEEPLLRTRPWYYMHVTADPVDPDTVYVQNYGIWKSSDAGATLVQLPTRHGDEHALWIDPIDHDRMIKGDDGGAAVTLNGGVTWSTIYNQPTAQFYHVITDDQFPYRIYGSQQDNTSLSLPSRTTDAAIHERTWFIPGGGESGYVAIKPDEPWHIVASGPAGRHIYNDIMTHYDHRTGQIRNITVWPELFGWSVGAESLKYRFQWTFPIFFSPHAPHDLYVASNHVHRSRDLGTSFDVISPDLTRNDPEKLRPSGGPITRDNTGAEVYGTIFALAESPCRPGVFWAGSDDGLVHLSQDGGATWQNVTPPDLPEWALIAIIDPSPHDPGTAYIAATRYKLDDTTPYLLRTSDFGATWTMITTGIPDGEFTRVIREDPNRAGFLLAGTETGVYVSPNDGAAWTRLGGNLPVAPVYDLIVKGVEVVVATHGRSFWILDDVTLLHQAADLEISEHPHLFAPPPTVRLRMYDGFAGDPAVGYVNYAHAGSSQVLYDPAPRADGTVGRAYLTAGTNPPDGVVFTYVLPDASAEDVSLTIRDARGDDVRTYTNDPSLDPPRVPVGPGIHRFVWNMRSPGPSRVTATDLSPGHRDGPLVMPGTYSAHLQVGSSTVEQAFEIVRDPRITTSDADLAEQRAFQLAIVAQWTRVNDLTNAVDAARAQVTPWKIRTDDARVGSAIAGLSNALDAIRPILIDVHRNGPQLYPTGIHEKLHALLDSTDGADYAPPRAARAVLAQLTGQIDDLAKRIHDLELTLVSDLNRAIAAAGLAPIGIDA